MQGRSDTYRNARGERREVLLVRNAYGDAAVAMGALFRECGVDDVLACGTARQPRSTSPRGSGTCTSRRRPRRPTAPSTRSLEGFSPTLAERALRQCFLPVRRGIPRADHPPSPASGPAPASPAAPCGWRPEACNGDLAQSLSDAEPGQGCQVVNRSFRSPAHASELGFSRKRDRRPLGTPPMCQRTDTPAVAYRSSTSSSKPREGSGARSPAS